MSRMTELSSLEDSLRARRLDVERVEDTFNVQQGTGIMATKAHIDPRRLFDTLSDDEEIRRRQIAGFVNGIKHVLLEPKRSSADEWDFVESAGRLVPAPQASTFTLGVQEAAGQTPWTVDFVDDLHFAYFIQLDRGLRVLTEAQVERWGVSEDRITAAARSLLFHKTRNLDFQPFEDNSEVQRLHAGDDLDAARCLVVADAFYSDIGDEFRFALPSTEHFLCVLQSTPDGLAELSDATRKIYLEADTPLSTRIFRFETGTPVAIEDSDDD